MSVINILSMNRLNAYTDAKGVYTLIGCMGCPLRCAYCLNPYTWDNSYESIALTVEELYHEVKKDNLYFLATNGGIIFGGGEPLIQHKFIKEFIEKYHETGWKFVLETSLYSKREALEDIIELIRGHIRTIKNIPSDDISFLENIEIYFNNTLKIIQYRKNNSENKDFYSAINI